MACNETSHLQSIFVGTREMLRREGPDSVRTHVGLVRGFGRRPEEAHRRDGTKSPPRARSTKTGKRQTEVDEVFGGSLSLKEEYKYFY